MALEAAGLGMRAWSMQTLGRSYSRTLRIFETAPYRRRIAAEEQLLRRGLPAYTGYCDRTKKLIPFVW